MGSRARNVLMGIAGGMQGYQQAVKLDREEEEHKLKKQFMEQQIDVYKDKLIESGTKRENAAKFRLMLKEKKGRGEKITAEDIMGYADIDEGVKFVLENLKEEFKAKQAATAEENKLQFGPAGSSAFRGGQFLMTMPEKTPPSKLLTLEEEEQKIRIGQATQRSRLMTPEEEAQQIRIFGAKQDIKPLESGVQKELLFTEKILENARMALINFEEGFVGPGAAKQGALKEALGETPIIGRLVGGPLSEKEATFRQSFSALKNAIRNKDFGAALTTFEAAEADKALSDLGKSPTSVRVALRRLGVLFKNALERQRMLAITPRSQLKKEATPNISIPEGFVGE